MGSKDIHIDGRAQAVLESLQSDSRISVGQTVRSTEINGRKGIAIDRTTIQAAYSQGTEDISVLHTLGGELLAENGLMNHQPAREAIESGRPPIGSVSEFERTGEKSFKVLEVLLYPRPEAMPKPVTHEA